MTILPETKNVLEFINTSTPPTAKVVITLK